MCIGLRVKHPLFLSDFNETRIFSTDFKINSEISHFMKIRPLGAESFLADTLEASNRFSKFCKPAKKCVVTVPQRLQCPK